LQRAAVQRLPLALVCVCATGMRRKSAVESGAAAGLEAFYTRLTHSYKLPGLQWSTDARSRAVLAVFTDRDRAAREFGLSSLFELGRADGPQAWNWTGITGALRRLTSSLTAVRLGAVKNDAPRRPKTKVALF